MIDDTIFAAVVSAAFGGSLAVNAILIGHVLRLERDRQRAVDLTRRVIEHAEGEEHRLRVITARISTAMLPPEQRTRVDAGETLPRRPHLAILRDE